MSGTDCNDPNSLTIKATEHCSYCSNTDGDKSILIPPDSTSLTSTMQDVCSQALESVPDSNSPGRPPPMLPPKKEKTVYANFDILKYVKEADHEANDSLQCSTNQPGTPSSQLSTPHT